jgi:hypothetical protein
MKMGNFGYTWVPCDTCKTGELEKLSGIDFNNGQFIPASEIPLEFRKAIMENSPNLSIAGEPVFETVECWKCLGAREYEIEYVACAIF